MFNFSKTHKLENKIHWGIFITLDNESSATYIKAV